ncbi:MAG: ATPase, T2SS/T4P/T4SS family [Pseudomonadota bacterium]
MAGYIISLLGGKGGVGKSVVAANLAYAYAEEAQSKVLLLDFDQKASGDQSFITGIKSKKTLKDLAEFSGVIDPRTLMPFLAMGNPSLAFIPMPSDPTLANTIDAENLGKFLKAVVNIFPVTVIDVGSELNALALKALEYSTVIFLVVTPDILVVNQTRRIQTDLNTMLFPKDMIQIVLNQHVKDHPVSPEVVSRQLGKPVFSVIPQDDQSCVAALTQNKPIMVAYKGSPFAKGIVEFARKIIQKNVLKTLSALNRPSELGKVAKKEDVAPGKKGRTPWSDLKGRIHRALVDEMDLKKVDDDDPKAKIILKEKTKKIVVDLLGKEDTKGVVNSREDMNRIVKEILDEALALGPLEDLLADKNVSEIMVVGPYKIYYEQKGKVKLSEITFTNERQVLNTIERIVAPIGRRIDEKTPYVDARLGDGSRVHAIIRPCAIDGATITIRKFPTNRLTYKDLVAFGSCSQPMADFLRIAVEAKRNIVVSGGTGSGKTTLINILAGFIPANERIITVEDSAELSLGQEHVVRLETRPPSLEGEGEISIRLLVKQTLRMRPERIIVGECRGGEALDMLQAMGTGHDGSMTSVHSNNPRECIGRLETLVQYAEAGLAPKSIRDMISNSIHLIVQQQRLEDGTRKITHITEISGMQGEVITMQDIFLFKQEDIDKTGKVIGKYQASGFIPRFIETLERKGYNIPRSIFTQST